MKKNDKKISPPPKNMDFFGLFDYIWDNGLGNYLRNNGDPTAWTAQTLADELESIRTPIEARTIDNWKARTTLPRQKYCHALARLVSCGDERLRTEWSDALWKTRHVEERKRKDKRNASDKYEVAAPSLEPPDPAVMGSPGLFSLNSRSVWAIGGLFIALIIGGGLLRTKTAETLPKVKKIRICAAPYFDKENGNCKKHIPVFMEGIKEVFLSFEFENVPEGAPFERWWIWNGLRVAGRTSYNDEAWPGYTFWRPERGLAVGEYVVRLVVDERVHTQVFQVQKAEMMN